MSDRRLPRPSMAREALERAVRREARSKRDVLELPRASELDIPLAAE